MMSANAWVNEANNIRGPFQFTADTDLQHLCIFTIIKNIKRWLPKNDSVYTRSPFNGIGPPIAQRIYDIYEELNGNVSPRYNFIKNDYERQACWRLLVTATIRRVKISNMTNIYSLHHVANYCHGIRELEIHHIQTADRFHAIILLFSNILSGLKSIEFYDCTVNGASLRLIRAECKDLENIRALQCKFLDRSLSQFIDYPSLQSADFLGTKVSSSGSIRVIRSNLNKLTLFRAKNVLDTLASLACKSIETNLNDHQFAIDANTIPLDHSILITSPKTKRLQIKCGCNVYSSILAPLGQLEHLRELHISRICEHNYKYSEQFFDNSILPILKAVGFRLESITFKLLVEVDMVEVARYCKNLKSLSIFSNKYVPFEESFRKWPTFRQITQFQFQSHVNTLNDNFNASMLVSILIHARDVEELTFGKSDLYSKDLFDMVFRYNKFKKLRQLELQDCELPSTALDVFIRRTLIDIKINGERAYIAAGRALEVTKAKALPHRPEPRVYTYFPYKK